MGKKKSSSSNSALVQMQKLANQTQVELQKMVNSANELQTRYNSEEAQKARDWQTNMSMTSHQMEVADLKAAGLNPVLSSGGSGAQSYTTSSASAQPESGAAALAALQGQQLSGISQLESTKIAAAATRAAAAQSASAMRAAAASSAAAQRYAADKAVQRAKLNNAAAIKIAKINKGGTIPGQIEKILTKAGIYGPGLKAIKNHFVTPGKNLLSKLGNNVSKYFSNTGTVNSSNFKLNSAGQKAVNSYLNSIGVKATAANRNAAVKSVIFGNNAYTTRLVKSSSFYSRARAKPKNSFW